MLLGLSAWAAASPRGQAASGAGAAPSAEAAAPASAPLPSAAPSPSSLLLDDFEDRATWSAHPADGVTLIIGSDEGTRGKALRLDFRFTGGGYAVARKALSLDLPENWAFRFRLKGKARPNHLEFKLIDSTGENVWWCVRRDMTFPADWETFTVKKRQVSFAWGPLGGGEIRHIAAIEIVVTAGSGGMGTVWLDDLELVTLPPPGAKLPAPRASASSARRGHAPASILDGKAKSFWSPSPDDAEPWIAVDFGAPREWGGLTVDWAPERHASNYVIEASDDSTTWRTVRAVPGGNGGRDYLDCAESESRWVRLRVPPRAAGDLAPGGGELALQEITVQPLAWSATREAFFGAIAAEAPRGSYPRGMSGEQVYWTVVGNASGKDEALLSEDGALETGKQRFSLEPFLLVDDRLVTWADVRTEQALADGSLPLPTVTWRRDSLVLETEAFAKETASSILVRYSLRNDASRPRQATLFVAIRPFQVNPPSQALNNPGGTARIREIERDESVVRVNGEIAVRSLTSFASFGASTFDGGDVVSDWLRQGRLPEAASVKDPFEAASAALAFPMELAAGGEAHVDLLVPFSNSSVPLVPVDDRWVDRERAKSHEAWSSLTNRVTIELPPSARSVVESVKSQIAYILINRAGPAIQPGTRSYARSWIRDGALTSSALLRIGHADAARDFLEWYAPYQYDNGKVPCVVDQRGADPVPEHDSCGEFIFLVAEVRRYASDRSLAERMWPRVLRAVAYLDSLRAERRTEEYGTPDKAEFFGILPPSISHEGYSAKPMHSYWDDFWAFRGFRDAAYLAGELGHVEEQARLEALTQEFGRDLAASVDAAMRRHGIDYVPGCADVGDFDATSTTIALAPTSAVDVLPHAAIDRTFERYWTFFRDRRGGAKWDAYTPYEIRNVGAFVRLGRREEAHELLKFFLADQRPAGWKQWPEVVWHDARTPHFLGDLPHGWVGSDYIRSVLDMLAYVREGDDALILGAGIPVEWLEQPGVTVRDLPTPWGTLDFTMRSADGGVETRVAGALRVPPGGIRVRPPLPRRAREAFVNDVAATIGEDGEVVIRELPAKVVVRR